MPECRRGALVIHWAMRELIEEYAADRKSLERTYSIRLARSTIDRFTKFNESWIERLRLVDFESLDRVGKFDFVLLDRHVRYQLRQLELRAEERRETLELVPFADRVTLLDESRKQMDPLDAPTAAENLASLVEAINDARAQLKGTSTDLGVSGPIALIEVLKQALKDWNAFYAGYDPAFDWWVEKPFEAVMKALDEYATFLRQEVAGVGADDPEPIVGRPAGRDSLIEALRHEMIPYSPEEIVAIGEREYQWCVDRFKEASGELGLGDDWMTAIEYVKGKHVAPGQQPQLVRRLALEAIGYVEERDLVTVPELAKETWRMAMMSAEDQKTNPFFLGGEQIIVSYPTQSMSHGEKLMSMRGNNAPFSRATVQHELIPGHHLQMYMTDRRRPYRKLFSTPFWIEGWTINWEMVLWDLGFPRTPEERIGMLFWRIHRAARIVFSIKYHLGEMTAEECVEMLVHRVGHERANAEGEVRRSIKGAYPPLYQAAYMIGGLQFRAMRRGLVDTGRMTLKQFHDAVMEENNIPPAILRSILHGETPEREFRADWRFDEE
jgi:uncharacterized protein (DUF885 family)